MRWAEERWPGYKYADKPEVRRDRAWAGAVLYRLTGDTAWSNVFKESFTPPQGGPGVPLAGNWSRHGSHASTVRTGIRAAKLLAAVPRPADS